MSDDAEDASKGHARLIWLILTAIIFRIGYGYGGGDAE